MTIRNSNTGMKTLNINWNLWYQIQQMQGIILYFSFFFYSIEFEFRYSEMNLYAKDPLNQIASLRVLQLIKITNPMIAILIRSTSPQLRKFLQQECEKNKKIMIRTRYKFNNLILFFDFIFSQAYFANCYLRYSVFSIFPVSQSSQQTYFKVFVYQLPNFITVGMQIKVKSVFMINIKNMIDLILKFYQASFFENIMDNCFLQSFNAHSSSRSQEPSPDIVKQSMKKTILVLIEIRKQYFKLYEEIQNICKPSLIAQISIKRQTTKVNEEDGIVKGCPLIKSTIEQRAHLIGKQITNPLMTNMIRSYSSAIGQSLT